MSWRTRIMRSGVSTVGTATRPGAGRTPGVPVTTKANSARRQTRRYPA